MGIPNATKQTASNAVAALGNWISLHTGDAATSGANEASGANYARAQTAWTPTGTGTNNGTEITIPVAAGNYSQGGIWTAGTAGTFVGSGSFSSVIAISGTGASIAVTPSISA